jgi:hypothetical protein
MEIKFVMPSNLNALIRYKTIDRCLSNRHRDWTIQDLIEACSDALGEYRGIYKTVSERTVRDDLRVMRSDILGFNAPIESGDGTYYYTDSSYSIFNVRVSDDKLLGRILELLLEIRSEISHPELEKMIERLSGLIPLRTGKTAARREAGPGEKGAGEEELAMPEAPPAGKAEEEKRYSRRRIFPSVSLRPGRRGGGMASVPETGTHARGGYVLAWTDIFGILPE